MAASQQRSPYTPGAIALHLPGRDVHLARVSVHLTNLSVYRQLDGRVHVFVGPRGVGKTSLLRVAQRDAQQRTFTTVWATGGDSVSLSVDLANEFDKLVTTTWTDTAKAALAKTLNTVRLNFGVASLQLATPADADNSTEFQGAARALQEAITAAARGVVEAGSPGLVVFIDELQAADAVGIRALAYAWQHMQAEAPDLPAAVFAAGLSHTQDTVAKAVSFGERFEYRHLNNLNRDDATLALTAPALGVGVGWEQGALDAVLQETQGYPYFLQEFGDKMWEAAGYPGPGGALTAQHFPAAREQFIVARNMLFRSRWKQASPAEAKFITAMASLGDGDVKRRDVATALGTRSTAISMARQSLMDKGLIEQSARGSMRFTAPGFAQYIRDYADVDADE
ncbi:ATP-binding protein [Mycolicibacterium poriferae]|uniref:ATP-binding protein n=1 Tax=Mycolicibacterium poriferae TaxID=39694 RepID=UPI0024B8DE9C|nr:ATP-binding protein [Mycolicibacterium poriferae]